jgi:hypothetical protein
MELRDRLEALKERNEHVYSDAEAKEIFLLALYDGKTKGEAARQASRTSSWFRCRCNPEASNYDPVFAGRYEAAASASRQEIVEDTFTAMVKAAKEGNVRAQEKILAAYSADFGWLKPQITQGPINVEQLQVFFGELPLEKLLELKAAREKTRKELPPVIDL